MTDRSPLVLLHGFPMDQRIWAAQAMALSDVADVLPVDLRGFGGPFMLGGLSMGV